MQKNLLKPHLLSILDFKPDRCLGMLPIVVGDLVHLIEEENQSGNWFQHRNKCSVILLGNPMKIVFIASKIKILYLCCGCRLAKRSSTILHLQIWTTVNEMKLTAVNVLKLLFGYKIWKTSFCSVADWCVVSVKDYLKTTVFLDNLIVVGGKLPFAC